MVGSQRHLSSFEEEKRMKGRRAEHKYSLLMLFCSCMSDTSFSASLIFSASCGFLAKGSTHLVHCCDRISCQTSVIELILNMRQIPAEKKNAQWLSRQYHSLHMHNVCPKATLYHFISISRLISTSISMPYS